MIDNTGYKLKYYNKNYSYEEAKNTFGSSAVYPNIILALFFENEKLLNSFPRIASEKETVTHCINNGVIIEKKIITNENIIIVPYDDIMLFGTYLECNPYTINMCYRYDKRSLINAINSDTYLKEILRVTEEGIVYNCSNKKINSMIYCDKEKNEYYDNILYLKELTNDFDIKKSKENLEDMKNTVKSVLL